MLSESELVPVRPRTEEQNCPIINMVRLCSEIQFRFGSDLEDGGAKLPHHKYDQVKFGNTIHHFDKYRREMCAAAVIISRSWVDAQPECITNSVSQTLLPSEI